MAAQNTSGLGTSEEHLDFPPISPVPTQQQRNVTHYADALDRIDLPVPLFKDWAVGYWLPIIRSTTMSNTYHAPDLDAEVPEPACMTEVGESREWVVGEWRHFRAWREPCGNPRCQEMFDSFGLDVHSNGRDH